MTLATHERWSKRQSAQHPRRRSPPLSHPVSSPRPPSTSESNVPHDSSYLPLHLDPSPGSFQLHATTQGGLRAMISRRKDPQFGRDTGKRLVSARCLFLAPPTAGGVHALSEVDEATGGGLLHPFEGEIHAGRPFSTRRGFRTKTSRRRPARAPLAKDVTRMTFSASPSGRGRAGEYSVEGRRGGVPLLSLKQRRNTSHPRSQRRSRDSDGALREGGGGAPSPPPDIFRCGGVR
ncbi:hypothetical protein GGG16DRAFT_124453 [Schizophyllum commune]